MSKKRLIKNLKFKNPLLSTSEIEGLLYIILNDKPSNNELIVKTGISKEILKVFKKSIEKYLVNDDLDSVELNDKGIEAVSEAQVSEHMWSIYNSDAKKKDEIIKRIDEFRKKYNKSAKREFDQFFATADTTYSKAKILNDKGLISGKRIALLGDDDLVSLAICMIDDSFTELLVLDIDTDLLEFIKSMCKELQVLNVRTEFYDAKNPIKPAFFNKYDVVVTDPPYTASGVDLFLNRSINLLNLDSISLGYVFLYYGSSINEPEKELKIQEVTQKYKLITEDKINKFARYTGAELIGSSSNLHVLRTTKFTDPLDNYVDAKIYTFEKSHIDKFPYVDHYVFKIRDVPNRLVSSKNMLQKVCGDFCRWHRLKVVDTKITKFSKKGLTMTYVLASSNLLVHTWPEMNAVHIDLITCSPIAKKEQFAQNLAELFKTNNIEITRIE